MSLVRNPSFLAVARLYAQARKTIEKKIGKRPVRESGDAWWRPIERQARFDHEVSKEFLRLIRQHHIYVEGVSE